MSLLRKLTTVLDFEVHEAPLEKISHQLEKMQSRLDVLAAGEVLRGIFELTERFSHFGEEIETAAIQAGLSAEQFQAMAFAASQNAVGQDELSGALAKLSRNMAEARDGSKTAVDAFAAVGITPAQVGSFKNSSEAMQVLADKIQGIQDPAKRVQVTMALLGRGSTNMIKMLGQGGAEIRSKMSEAASAGAIVSDANIKALADVEDAMSAVGQVIKATAATFAAGFAPAITQASKALIKFWAANKDVISLNVKKWTYDLTYALGFIYGALEDTTQVFFDFIKAHGTLLSKVGEVLLGLGAFALTLEAGNKTIGTFGKGIKFFVDAITSLAEVIASPFKIFLGAVGFARGGLIKLLVKLAVLTETALPALSSAFLAMGGILEATPIGWIATAIAAIVVASHDLWTLWSGGKFEDTWIYKAVTAIKSLSVGVLKKLGLYEDVKLHPVELPPQVAQGDAPASLEADPDLRARKFAPIKVPGFLDASNADEGAKFKGGMQNLADVLAKQKDGSQRILTLGEANFGLPKGQTFNVEAPITINVPPGTDPKQVGVMVADATKNHLTTAIKQASVNGASPMKY